MNLLKASDWGLQNNMQNAAHPLVGVDSSNPRRQMGWRLHYHGDGVC